ncbi:metallo-dependent phosphatase-like protein [Nitzschia inconspicua]|uniref:Double-strand break repair protein n=1 Tax=Nitzschia inconspicua TaxID=303405 RepID=A0A9K3PN29_9STRA|nr:metallo-dependent phosphatase-like protein [Nitzschia inconspicua]
MPARGSRRRRRDEEEDFPEETKEVEMDEPDEPMNSSTLTFGREGLDSSTATHSFISEQHNQEAQGLYVEDPDNDTVRIMLSTDNHVGYAEDDNVRGNDSFAALEEVLYLAKFYRCDMVLLAGDLFHDNRPTRRTLYKTMDIFRRYCMGPDAIQVQIVKTAVDPSTESHSKNKRNSSPFTRGFANYEDEFYSVDLPVFSIHGNHDDPSRDGGNSDLYAALDLLDVANLVNYFGKQEAVDEVRVDPILLKKGNTKVALYGLSNMRDERLNRMWRGEKLSFTQPAPSGGEENGPAWFNILALHQNRDYGRGSKNCIKEDMIPDWFDFVCWGHEHECSIEVQESVVGTFRISQPGSSVATSLVAGEAERKRVGLLDIKESNFRLTAIPLTQVRSFVLGTLNLAQERRLDPDDPKSDIKVSNVMEEKVRVLIHEAREKREELLEAASKEGNVLAKYFIDSEQHGPPPLKNLIQKEEEVLVRLKVDHTGFPAMNNQRFGAKFVGEVANPTDILLFHRKKADSGSRKTNVKNINPIVPDEIAEMNIEDLIVEELDASDKKLQLMDERKISSALDKYVEKSEAQALNEAINEILTKKQRQLIKSGAMGSSHLSGNEEKDDDDGEMEKENKSRKPKSRKNQTSQEDDEDDFDDMEEDEAPSKSKRGKPSASSKRGTTTTSRKKKRDEYDDDDNELDDEDISIVEKSKSRSKAPTSRAAGGRGRKNLSYAEDSEDDEDMEMEPPPKSKRATKKPIDRSLDVDSDDDDDDDDSPPPKKKAARGRATATPSKSKKGTSSSGKSLSQSQLSFTSTKRKPATKSRNQRNDDDSDDDEDFITPSARSSGRYDDDDDWGTAKSNSTFD